MPRIQLDGSPQDHDRVMAVMLFPGNERMRETFLAVYCVLAEVKDAKDSDYIPIDAKTLRLLLETPSYQDLQKLIGESTKRGMVAGDILGTLYVMDKCSVPEPSMNKAIYVAQKFAARAKWGDGTRLNRSEPKILEYWEEFNTVAHLWGALGLNRSYPYAPHQTELSEEGFLPFLGVAAGLQQFGCSFIPKRSKSNTTVLDPKKSWRLPKSVIPLNLKSDRDPDRILEALKNYKAPKSKF